MVGEGQIQVVDGLTRVASIVRHHHENVDGSGYPDGLVANQIPVGARIIRVLNEYDVLSRGGARKGAAERLVLEALDKQVSRHFDPNVYNALLDALEKRKDTYDANLEMKVLLDDLEEGMTLCRDLVTQTGILLVPKDEPLRASYLKKIHSFREIYPTDPHAYVYRAA